MVTSMQSVAVLFVAICVLAAGLKVRGQQNQDSPIYDPIHGVKMGISYKPCDDGKDGIEIDWDPSNKTEITCVPSENRRLHRNRPSDKYIDVDQDPGNAPMHHVCLTDPIVYNTPIPLSGNHRPLWPKFGEYRYVPPQRWVHSLEHGAIVFLYHPCAYVANKTEVDAFKSAVRGCLRKHIISPYRRIPDNMPFALLAYGHARLLKEFDRNLVTSFIKEFAMKGPERRVTDDGQYSAGIIQGAAIVSNIADTNLCPDM